MYTLQDIIKNFKLKVGDKIRCVKSETDLFTKDKIYTIQEYTSKYHPEGTLGIRNNKQVMNIDSLSLFVLHNSSLTEEDML